MFILLLVSYSPVVQWSSMRAFGARDPGSNPGGAIRLGKIKMVFKENFKDISSFGGLPLYFFVSLLFLALGFKEIFYRLVIALFLLYIVFFVVRSIYFKERPKKLKYKNWLEKIDANSFPSAHALRATVLGLIMISFFSSVYVNFLILFIIFLEGFMRVKLKQHFWSDVIFGWIFGVLIWFLITSFF